MAKTVTEIGKVNWTKDKRKDEREWFRYMCSVVKYIWFITATSFKIAEFEMLMATTVLENADLI